MQSKLATMQHKVVFVVIKENDRKYDKAKKEKIMVQQGNKDLHKG